MDICHKTGSGKEHTILTGDDAAAIVKDGACKENVITGKNVDLAQLPAPHWNRLDGGRYLITYAGVVTKDPTTNVMNVGIYRGMVTSPTPSRS